jgi:hypothetical protein
MYATLTWESRLTARGGQPLLDLTLFHDSTFSRGLVVNVGAFASFHSFLFTLTLVMQAGLGLSPMAAGLTFAPLGVAFALASVSAKGLIARRGAQVISIGTAIAALGLLILLVTLRISAGSTTAGELILPMVLVGLGNGLAVPALVGAVLAGVKVRAAGAAAGVLTTSQQFASAAGIAALGSIFFGALGHGRSVGAYVSALQWEALFSLVLAIAACGLSMLLPRPGQLAARAAAAAGAAPETAATKT